MSECVWCGDEFDAKPSNKYHAGHCCGEQCFLAAKNKLGICANWEKHFSKRIETELGGKCYFSKEEFKELKK